MRFYAHRGLSKRYKDNSVESIREAIYENYDGVEIDVQLSKDYEIVLFHDLYINNKFIQDMLFSELRDLGVISLRNLYDNLDLTTVNLIIDIKGIDRQIIEELKYFYRNKKHNNIYFCSFNRDILLNLPYEFKKGFIFENIFHKSEIEYLTRGFSCVVIHWTCLNNEIIEFCKQKSIKTFTYTHKEECEIEYMKKFDVDYIITNGL